MAPCEYCDNDAPAGQKICADCREDWLDDWGGGLSEQDTAKGGQESRVVRSQLGDEETDPNSLRPRNFDPNWAPPKKLAGHYRLEEFLGRGGMGVVCRYRDTELKRPVAVKFISGGTIARFQTEAEAIAQLNHPNIAQIHGFYRQDDPHYIVMEYVDGESLSQRLNSIGKIPVRDAVEITIGLCDALAHAHSKGIIHRDIKPSNVLLNREEVPKLVDFGLARIDSDDGQLTRGGLGTPAYVAPEQAKHGTLADARSDLWSLAATLYHMVTGEVPGRVLDLDEVPNSTKGVLIRALKTDPDARYQTADDFRVALVSIAAPPAKSAKVLPIREGLPAIDPTDERLNLVGVGLIVAVVMLVVIALSYRPPEGDQAVTAVAQLPLQPSPVETPEEEPPAIKQAPSAPPRTTPPSGTTDTPKTPPGPSVESTGDPKPTTPKPPVSVSPPGKDETKRGPEEKPAPRKGPGFKSGQKKRTVEDVLREQEEVRRKREAERHESRPRIGRPKSQLNKRKIYEEDPKTGKKKLVPVTPENDPDRRP